MKNCRCAEIMQTDPKRHFEGCPLRVERPLVEVGFEPVALGVPRMNLRLLPRDFPRLVTLCGSTRFKEAFAAANLSETLAGRIVLSVGCYTHSDSELGITEDVKVRLDELHKRKIDLADEVLVLNQFLCPGCGGQGMAYSKEHPHENGWARCVGLAKLYIGESTKSEILYAAGLGKRIRWLNPPGCFTLPDGRCVGAGCMHDVKETL